MNRSFCDVCDKVIDDGDMTYRIMFSQHQESLYAAQSDSVIIGGIWVSANSPYNDVCGNCFVKVLTFVRQFYPKKEGS